MEFSTVHGKLDGWKKLDGCRDDILSVVAGTNGLHVASMFSLWNEEIFDSSYLKSDAHIYLSVFFRSHSIIITRAPFDMKL